MSRSGHLGHRRSRRDGRSDAPSTNPARLDEVVGEVSFADAGDLRPGGRVGPQGPGGAGRRCRRRSAAAAIAHIGRLVEDNAEALARLVTARDRQAVRARRSARSARSSTPATSSSARGAGSTARPCPARCRDKQLFTFRKPVGRGRGDHRRQLPGRRAVLVHRARAAGRQHRRLEAGRVRRGRLGGLPRALRPRRRAARRGVQHRARRRRGDVRRAGAGPGRGADRQGRLHRLLRGRPGDRRADRAAPADRVPGARRQEPAGGHPERRPRPGRGGRAVLRLRHRRAALHLARHGDRARVGA